MAELALVQGMENFGAAASGMYFPVSSILIIYQQHEISNIGSAVRWAGGDGGNRKNWCFRRSDL